MGAEKRAFTRHEVRWDAEVRDPAGAALAMEIRDFCEGGLFLVAASRTAAASLKQIINPGKTVILHMRDPFNGRDQRVRARAAHVTATGLGLSFHQPAPAMVTGLMAVSAGQVSAGDDDAANEPAPLGNREREEFRRILGECLPLIQDYLGHSLDTFITQAEARLLTASDKATTPAEQSDFFNARKRLQSRSQELRSAFLADAEAAWRELGQFAIPGNDSQQGQLALVDDADFEDWLARSELITRAESRSRARLRFLHRRLSRAAGVRIEEERNPVSPAALCYFVSRRMDSLKLTLQTRKVVYQAFGKTVLQQSGVLYDTLNTRLRERNVLPGLEEERHTITNVRSEEQRTGDARSEQSDGNAATAATTQERPGGAGFGSLMDSVRSLFQRQRSKGSGTDASPGAETEASTPPAAGPAPSREAMIEAAATIQPPAADQAGMREQVESRLREAGAPALDAATAESVDLLETWITGVQRTGDQADQLRTWVNALAPAALRLELNDGSFLSRRDHGLHRLIDHLDRAADILGSLDESQRQAMRGAIDEILTTVNRDADEPDTLVEACDSLAKLTDNPQRRVSANVERLRERYEGSERLDEARRQVQDNLAAQLGGSRIPEPVQNLLDSGWQHHLVLTYLRDGKEGDTWERGLRAVDLLVRALGGQDGRRHGMKQPQRLLEYLRHHLDRLGRPSRDSGHAVDGLAYWVTGDGRDSVPPQSEPLTPQQHPEAPDLPDEWLGQAKLLSPGAWVIFRDEQGLPKPRRLAWTDRRRSRFVFVDEGGRKAEDLGLEALAHAFGEGRATTASNLDLPATERRWQEMLEGLNRQLVHQATHDDLTGLLNRRTFERRIRHVLEHARGRKVNHATACLFSLDDFKLVNNTLGHRGGDEILRQLGQRLQDALPAQGVVARTGGDEFAVLMRGVEGEAGEAFAEEQRHAIRDWRPQVDGHGTSLSVSVGVLTFSPETHGVSDVLRDLENACTTAREQGGNRCHVTDAQDLEAADLRSNVEQVARVDRALESQRLELSCQRIEPLTRGRAPLYEVLIASAGDPQNTIRPQEFIPAAERFGRMPAVDRWVIRETFAWCAANPGRLDEVDALCINLSAQTLADVDFAQWLRQTLQTHRVQASKICFELTETAATANLGLTADLLLALKDLGCRFALDDFGGGLSSYTDLKNLPADILKIDGAFIRDMDRNAADRNVVQSVHDLAHHLGKLTVAEFVETEDVYQQARELGLDYVQGYHVERPCPLDELGLQRLDLPV